MSTTLPELIVKMLLALLPLTVSVPVVGPLMVNETLMGILPLVNVIVWGGEASAKLMTSPEPAAHRIAMSRCRYRRY
jgi:hypothetical protein